MSAFTTTPHVLNLLDALDKYTAVIRAHYEARALQREPEADSRNQDQKNEADRGEALFEAGYALVWAQVAFTLEAKMGDEDRAAREWADFSELRDLLKVLEAALEDTSLADLKRRWLRDNPVSWPPEHEDLDPTN